MNDYYQSLEELDLATRQLEASMASDAEMFSALIIGVMNYHIIVSVIFYLGLCMIVAGLAERLNRSVIGYLGFGMAFTPLAPLLILILIGKRGEQQDESPARPSVREEPVIGQLKSWQVKTEPTVGLMRS